MNGFCRCILLIQLPINTLLSHAEPFEAVGGSVNGYFTLEEAYAVLDDLIKLYPNLVTREQIGESFEGLPMYVYIFGDKGSHSKINLLLTSVWHGREPVTLLVTVNAMRRLVYQSAGGNVFYAALLESTQIHLAPLANPDAYHAGVIDRDFKYRKNRRPTCAEHPVSSGIDLNRNFDFHWTNQSKFTQDPCGEEYAGEYPFSEPEAAAIASYAESSNISSAMQFHSFGEILTYPYNWNASYSLEPSHQQFYDELQKVFKFGKAGPVAKTIGYETTGESDDWFYGALGILSMSPEVGPESEGFNPSPESIKNIIDVNFQRIVYWIFKSSGEISQLRTVFRDDHIGIEIMNTGLSYIDKVTVGIRLFGGACSDCGTHTCEHTSDDLRIYRDITTNMLPRTWSPVVTVPTCGRVIDEEDTLRICVVHDRLCRCFSNTRNGTFLSIPPGRYSNHEVDSGLCSMAGRQTLESSHDEINDHVMSDLTIPVFLLIASLSVVMFGIVRKVVISHHDDRYARYELPSDE